MKEYSAESIEREVEKKLSKLKAPNILICGQTGAGKSSAINFLFKDNVAEVSSGEPCTKDIQYYKGDAYNLYDSEGYEIGGEKQKKYRRLVFDDFLEKKKGLGDDAVHLVWYTISGAGKRFTDLDIELINEIKSASYKICILLTKIDELEEEQLNEMVDEISKEIKDVPIFRLSTDSLPAVQKFCDWDELIDWSMDNLDEIFKDRFVSGLRDGLKEKRKRANVVIVGATLAAGGAAASPIPFSDAPIIVTIQTAMIIKILGIYGIKIADSSVLSLATTSTVAVVGRTIAGNLLKLIPGLGTAVGDMINAAVASSFTAAMGKSVESLCYNQAKDMLDGKSVSMDIEEIFKSANFIKSIREVAKNT